MIKVRKNVTLFFILILNGNKSFDVIITISEINHEIHQILRLVESLKVSMNGLTSLIREIIQRLDVLEKNNESLKVQSVLDECNTLGVFPIATAASLKEVESIIENNSAFKKNLVNFIFNIISFTEVHFLICTMYI